jgi:hypothetical protein
MKYGNPLLILNLCLVNLVQLSFRFRSPPYHIISYHFVHVISYCTSFHFVLLPCIVSHVASHFITLFVKKITLPKPSSKTTPRTQANKGKVDLCQFHQVYLYPFYN